MDRKTLIAFGLQLAALAAKEQDKAKLLDIRADGLKAGQRALALGDRDKHIARGAAFTEAAKLALEESKK